MSFVNGIDTHVKRSDGATPLLVALCDANGNPIGSFRGALDFHDADVHREIVNHQFHQHTATTTTLAVAASAGDYVVTVADSTGFSVGDYVHINGADTEETHPKITAISVNDITINRPLDYDHPIGGEFTKSLVNMAVLATQANPQSFKVEPYGNQVMHLTRILIEMTHGTAGDNGLFGDLTALTNGVVLRRYDGTTGLTSTFTVWQTNSDIVTDMYDVSYSARSGGGGNYGTNCRGTFKNAEAIVYLDGSLGDYLEILVQDDLSGLVSFRVKAQGHYEGT